MFTSVLTIDSNEFSDSGSYCCVVAAAVIGSGDLKKMDCMTLNVLGKVILHEIIIIHSYFTDITISGQHTDLTVGTTYTITCTLPGLDDSTILWTSTAAAAAVPVSTANTLTLQSVDSTLNGTVFTCSVNSSKLYSSGMEKITVTIQSMSDKFSMSTLNLLIFCLKDTRVTMVSIEPQSVTALVGTPPVVFTCTITLSHDIGPDHSALSVDWSSVKSSATPEMGMHSVFQSMTTLTLNSSTQPIYCCNARVVGTNVGINCSLIQILGEQSH